MITYNATISARERCQQRQRALGVQAGPNVITFTRRSAPARRPSMEANARLPEEMRGPRQEPDVFNSNAAISACEKGPAGQRSLYS